MSDDLAWALALVVAAVLAAGLALLGPRVIGRLVEPEPDPQHPDDPPKPLYADLARTPGLPVRLAVGAAAGVLLAGSGLDERALLGGWVVFAVIGSWLAFIDARTQLLPFQLTVPLHVLVLLAVALAALVAQDWSLLVKGLIGNVVVFVLFAFMYVLGRFLALPFGYGDVRVSAVIGLLLGASGYSETLIGLFGGFVLGSVAGLVLVALGRVGRKDPFPFGPWLIIGAFLGPPLASILG